MLSVPRLAQRADDEHAHGAAVVYDEDAHDPSRCAECHQGQVQRTFVTLDPRMAANRTTPNVSSQIQEVPAPAQRKPAVIPPSTE
ncbi:hypothetical protein acdb102_17420 [Acidothermaceae bacterium B102]|nr:hypothetical protein acdb102_17420 [Acidothermaceae bacterium B102]